MKMQAFLFINETPSVQMNAVFVNAQFMGNNGDHRLDQTLHKRKLIQRSEIGE